MQIRVGYELTYDCVQPTPMVLLLNVHHSRVADLVAPDHRDDGPRGAGAWISRRLRQLVQPHRGAARPHPHREFGPAQRYRQARSGGPVGRSSTRCRICRTMCWCSCSAADIARPIICRKRRGGCSSMRHQAGGACRRSATSSISTSNSTTWPAAANAHRVGSISREGRRLPRFRASRGGAVPVHEHSGALLHRLSQRYRRAAAIFRYGFRRLVRGISRRRLVYVRPA